MQDGKIDIKEEFHKFWVIACRKYKLDQSLESAVWLHLKSIKCDVSEKFITGLKSFGFKLGE